MIVVGLGPPPITVLVLPGGRITVELFVVEDVAMRGGGGRVTIGGRIRGPMDEPPVVRLANGGLPNVELGSPAAPGGRMTVPPAGGLMLPPAGMIDEGVNPESDQI